MDFFSGAERTKDQQTGKIAFMRFLVPQTFREDKRAVGITCGSALSVIYLVDIRVCIIDMYDWRFIGCESICLS